MGEPTWDDADRREWFEERAAIMELDGGLTRAEAEHEARRLLKEEDARRAQPG